MKKILLIAAAAAAVMCANAQPTVEQLWRVDGMATLAPTADCRQGFGMNGKVYINNKADQKVLVFGENGLTNEEFPGGANTGITRDEAGNIIVVLNGWPGKWTSDGVTPTIKVYNPNDPTIVKEYFIPTDLVFPDAPDTNHPARCDFIGFAKGNLLENGELYYVPGSAGETMMKLVITDGEVDLDESYVPTINGGVSPTSSNLIHCYVNKDGAERLLYVVRNAPIKILAADGDNFMVESAPTFPGKSASNGAQIFVWNGEEYGVYPSGGNYLDGFSIAKMGEAEAFYVKTPELGANPNGFQANWVNAEVVEDGVMIYHYVPGGYVEAFKMTQEGGVSTGDVNGDGEVDVRDITALIDVIMNSITDNPRADVNADGDIDVRDITALIDIIMNS